MTNDLIERLKIIEQYLLDVSNGEDAEYEFAECIHHTINALSAPMPCAVEAAIEFYRDGVGDNRITADLIERMQRRINELESTQ